MAEIGSSFTSDIAIDDISFTSQCCVSGKKADLAL